MEQHNASPGMTATTPGRQSGPQESPSYRCRIATLLQRVNPAKLLSLDALMRKYRGGEDVLIDKICQKYGVQEQQNDAAANVAPQTWGSVAHNAPPGGAGHRPARRVSLMQNTTQSPASGPQLLQSPASGPQPPQSPVSGSQQGYPQSQVRAHRGVSWQHHDMPVAEAQRFDDDDQLRMATDDRQPEPDPTPIEGETLTLSARVEYSALSRGSTQEVFGLVTLQAPSVSGEQERQAMDLGCVLDVSGSMQGEKLRQVQEAVRFVISQALPADRISLVAFNHGANRVLRLRCMDSEGRNEATAAVLRLTAQGGTAIAAGLEQAVQIMEQRRQRNRVSALLLLTDGIDRSARSRLPSLIARARAAGCTIYTFGFGVDHDADLLSEIAEQAQTPFTYVEDAEHIGEAFAGAVGGLSSVIAQQVEVTLTGHVALKEVHTAFTVRRTSDSSAVVSIPDFFAGERRDVVMELVVPAAENALGKTVLLEASARYVDLTRQKGVGVTVQSRAVLMEAERVAEPQPEAEPDEEVSAQRERVEVTHALQEAAAHSDAGRFDAAQQVIEAADQRLEAAGKTKKKKTTVSTALAQELADARSRMVCQSSWERGGRAEVKDACQMHKTQRCTSALSSKAGAMKCSKAMYLSEQQSEWVSKSKK